MSLQDSLFSEEVEKDIKEFVVKEKRKRVLVFPHVNNYRRFLIHQFVQNEFQQLLYTFSIGQGPQRRTVVCYKSDVIRDPKLNGALPGACGVDTISDRACAMGVEGHRSPLVSPENTRQRQVKSVPSIGIYRQPPARKAQCENQIDFQQDQQASDSSQSSKANRQKRPDRAVYVPRHRRSNETEGTSLSRETSKAPRSTRERRSTTRSPTRASPRSSIDNTRVTPDSCLTIQGIENENDVSSRLSVEDTEKSEINSCGLTGNLLRQDYSEGNVPEDDDMLISSNSAESDNDKFTCEKLSVSSKADVFMPTTLETGIPDEGVVEKLEDTSQRRNSALMVIGFNDESSDNFVTVQPEIVQRDEEPQPIQSQLSNDQLTFHSHTAETEKPEINQDQQLTKSIEEEEGVEIETDKGISSSNQYTEILSLQGDTNGDSPVLIMSQDSNRKSETESTEEHLNRDEIVNHKNRRIIRQNLVSDVLLISDEEPIQETIVAKPPVTPVSPTLRPKDKKIKKIERPKSKPAPPPVPAIKINRDECDWDSLFDDNGDCLDPTLIEELTSAVGEVTIEQPKSDYRAYSKTPVELSNDEFAHVVEIYNFPSDFKTSDLAAVFSPFKNGGFELKWVDDTHCLGVFSSPLIAAEVLASDHSFVKTRPLSEATALSKTKARRSAEFLQPYRARPETCAALARRLVTGALGVRLATARQEREREKIVLREAKERRRLANKQRADAWDGIIADK